MIYSKSEKTAVDTLVEELTNNIVGETITNIEKTNYDTHVFTLGNGTKFTVTNLSDCCAYGEISDYTKITNTDNIITSLKLVEDDTWSKTFTIFLLSAMEETLEIKGKVDEGTGYYTFGWELNIIL